MRDIIGLTGYAGAGKDEAATALVQVYGFTRIGFADTLKEVLVKLDPIVYFHPTDSYVRASTIVYKYGWRDAKDKFPEIRQLLQRLGTEAGREIFGDSFWIERAFDRMDRLPYAKPVVMTDVRFENEANAIRHRGGKVVRIQRPGCNPVNGHVSDSGVDRLSVDAILDNTGSVGDLHKGIIRYYEGSYKKTTGQLYGTGNGFGEVPF